MGAKIDLPFPLLWKEISPLRNCVTKMIPERITVRAALVRNKNTVERQSSVLRTSFGSLNSKESLMNFVFNELFSDFNDIERSNQNFKIERKSKKHKKFVSLEYADDFKELMRSVKVKNHVKLVIYEIDVNVQPKESSVTEALDQVRSLVGELQKSELWEILKSFTTAYNMQLSPNGECLSDNVGKNVKPENAQQDDIVHEFVACDFCHPLETFGNIHGKRYKCAVCENFDLCEPCYLSNVEIMGHHPDHPMMVIPDSRHFRSFHHSSVLSQNVDRNQDSCPDIALRTHQEFSFKGLLNQRLGPDNPHLLSEIEKCIVSSEKYHALEDLLGDLPVETSDKFELLKEIVTRSSRSGQASESSQNDHIPSQRYENVIIRNTSINHVPAGRVVLECYSCSGNKLWAKEHELYDLLGPGKAFSLDLEPLGCDYSPGTELRMLHSDSGLPMFGQFGSVINLSCPEVGDLAENTEVETLEPLCRNLTNIELEITVIPKGTTLSQIMIANKSELVFECHNLDFELINCFGKVVATVSAHRRHSLLPGRVAKFNIPINNAHFKYPFKLNVNNGTLQGCCELSLRSLSQDMKLLPTHRSSRGNFQSAEVTSSTEKVAFGAELSNDSGDSAVQQYEINEDVEDDFDLISLPDVEEAPSDFEVLSNVNSYEI